MRPPRLGDRVSGARARPAPPGAGRRRPGTGAAGGGRGRGPGGPQRRPLADRHGVALSGLLESDPEILLAAVEAVAQGSRPLELGLACEDAGTALAGTGRVDAGLPLLERALGIYERLEAARDLDRTRARLRRLGIRLGRRGRGGRPQFGWESLTPHRGAGRGPGLGRPDQPPDRRAAVRVAAHGADPPRSHLRQAGHLHTRPARRPGNPSASQVTW